MKVRSFSGLMSSSSSFAKDEVRQISFLCEGVLLLRKAFSLVLTNYITLLKETPNFNDTQFVIGVQLHITP